MAESKARTKEVQEQAEKLRRREQEEYDYILKREREQKTNALQDEISRLEKDLAQKNEAFAKKVAIKDGGVEGAGDGGGPGGKTVDRP